MAGVRSTMADIRTTVKILELYRWLLTIARSTAERREYRRIMDGYERRLQRLKARLATLQRRKEARQNANSQGNAQLWLTQCGQTKKPPK